MHRRFIPALLAVAAAGGALSPGVAARSASSPPETVAASCDRRWQNPHLPEVAVRVRRYVPGRPSSWAHFDDVLNPREQISWWLCSETEGWLWLYTFGPDTTPERLWPWPNTGINSVQAGHVLETQPQVLPEGSRNMNVRIFLTRDQNPPPPVEGYRVRELPNTEEQQIILMKAAEGTQYYADLRLGMP